MKRLLTVSNIRVNLYLDREAYAILVRRAPGERSSFASKAIKDAGNIGDLILQLKVKIQELKVDEKE